MMGCLSCNSPNTYTDEDGTINCLDCGYEDTSFKKVKKKNESREAM